MTSQRPLVISLLCLMFVCSSVSGDGVQQWSNVESVAGDMLLVENFPRTAGRHSKSSGDGGSSSKGTKSSKSGKGKGSGSKGSKGSKETESDSSSTDDSKSDKDSKSDTDTDSDSGDSSSTTSSDETTKSSDESTKTSQSDSKSLTRESTETDRSGSSSTSDDSRDPSESSESDDTESSAQDNRSVNTEEDVTKDSEDVNTEEYVTKDSEDGTFPSDSRDQVPTKKPTSHPTSKPSSTRPPTASGMTDKAPTSSPSMGPTVPPTDNVFEQPTVAADTPDPTYFPTDTPRCQLNALGAFGVISQDRREFEFFYQIETTADTTEDILRSDILPLLEREYGNRLLASLFTDCGEERRLQEGGDSCEAMGFSGLPIDRALAGVSCMPGSRVETSNTCYAVDGGLRMFFDGECTPDTDADIMTAIRDVINSGDYDRLDPRIINVIYLDISDINLDDVNTRARSGGSSETTKLPGYAIVLLTIAALCIVVGSLLFVGRRKPQDKNGFDSIPDDEGEGDF